MTSQPSRPEPTTRIALRELRGGWRGFRVFLACLALGVTIVAGVGSVAEAIRTGLANDARELLGGDVELRIVFREASEEQYRHLADAGTITHLVRMRAMARSPETESRRLVELKAVDDLYPLFGTLEVAPAQSTGKPLGAVDGRWGAIVEDSLLSLLDVAIGDSIEIGDQSYTVRATVVREPDRGGDAFGFGPRVFVDRASLATTGLMTPGSLLYHHYRVALPDDVSIPAWISDLEERFPNAGWRVRDYRNASPGIRQFVGRIGGFLALVGLTALLVGGIGVTDSVRAYLLSRQRNIAILRCVGASSGTVFRAYLMQIMIMAMTGTAVGVALGAAAPPILAAMAGTALPIPLAVGIYPLPLLLAAAFGILTALLFSLGPLAAIREISPAALFRGTTEALRARLRPRDYLAICVCAVILAGLAIATSPQPAFAAVFVGGAIIALMIFRLTGFAASRVAARLARLRGLTQGRPKLRLALANLYRPGAPTLNVVPSIGLGFSVLAAVALVESNLDSLVTQSLPEEAPTFFFIDIQPNQVAAFDAAVSATPGAQPPTRMPMLRGRFEKFGGVPVTEVTVNPEVAWALRGDRGITYSETPPEGTAIASGQWWPAGYSGPPLMSLDAGIARGFGLGVGDTVTLNILGRSFTAEIANLRDIDWTSMGMNFTIVFAPGLLETAPHTHIATVHVEEEREDALFRDITDRFPNVSAIPVKDALRTVNEVIGHIATAVAVVAGVAVLAGMLVLAGAVAADHRRRVYDSVVMKTLGATRADVMGLLTLEYGALAVLTASIAGGIAIVTSWAVTTYVLRADWIFDLQALMVTGAGCIILVLGGGLLGSWRALGQSVAPHLRND